MYIATRIVGSVVLIIIAGPYVSHYLDLRANWTDGSSRSRYRALHDPSAALLC